MTPKKDFDRVSLVSRPLDDRSPQLPELFHERGVRQDLAALSESPGLLSQYLQRLRVRFTKANERAVIDEWIAHYQSASRLMAAMAELERQKTEFLQVSRDPEIKTRERETTLARLDADREEQELRREKAAYQRRNIERFVEGRQDHDGEYESKLNVARKRRELDIRWDIHESLRPLQSLIELQRWRREQRDRILQDRSLSSQEQKEDLQFVDELFEQKRAELRTDTRIFEE